MELLSNINVKLYYLEYIMSSKRPPTVPREPNKPIRRFSKAGNPGLEAALEEFKKGPRTLADSTSANTVELVVASPVAGTGKMGSLHIHFNFDPRFIAIFKNSEVKQALRQLAYNVSLNTGGNQQEIDRTLQEVRMALAKAFPEGKVPATFANLNRVHQIIDKVTSKYERDRHDDTRPNPEA